MKRRYVGAKGPRSRALSLLYGGTRQVVCLKPYGRVVCVIRWNFPFRGGALGKCKGGGVH